MNFSLPHCDIYMLYNVPKGYSMQRTFCEFANGSSQPRLTRTKICEDFPLNSAGIRTRESFNIGFQTVCVQRKVRILWNYELKSLNYAGWL